MKAEFRPIAMRCNKEQFEAIKPKLKNANFKIKDVSPCFNTCNFLTNCYNGQRNVISNISEYHCNSYERMAYTTWDENTFLLSCGIEIHESAVPNKGKVLRQTKHTVEIQYGNNDESAKSNPQVKQYKHIPTGKIVESSEIEGFYAIDGIALPNWLIENSSDWEEVKPKEYEILSFSCNALGGETIICKNSDNSFGMFGVEESNFINSPIHKIHSVKRLSDGEVFTVGELVSREDGLFKGVLLSINEKFEATTSSEEKIGMSWLIKVNQPLFTTEDGVEIRKGDKYFAVQKSTFNILPCNHPLTEIDKWATFSSKEKASEYVLINRPCLSVNDIVGKSKSSMISELVELAKSKING